MEKILTFHHVIILTKSVVNKNKNEYFYNVFLEKGLYKDKSDTRNFQMNVCIFWMLYFNRIDVFEGIDVNKNKCINRVLYLSLLVFLKL